MTSLLLIISFLFHLIAFAAIFQLLKKVQRLENRANPEAFQAIMEHALEEIKEENDRLQRMIPVYKGNEVKIEQTKDSQTTANQATDEPQTPISPIQTNKDEHPQTGIERLLNDEQEDKVEASLESRVLQLHSQGVPVEDIAKTLDCGKTEAELIIKFYEK